jgi:hypothetical protein
MYKIPVCKNKIYVPVKTLLGCSVGESVHPDFYRVHHTIEIEIRVG